MKTIRRLFYCLAMSLVSLSASAMDICVQANGNGCRDLISGKVYVPSGNKLVDPETRQVFMEVEPIKPGSYTALDQLQKQKTAEEKPQAKNSETSSAGDDDARQPVLLIVVPGLITGRTSSGAVFTDELFLPAGGGGHIGRHGRFLGPAGKGGDKDNHRGPEQHSQSGRDIPNRVTPSGSSSRTPLPLCRR